MASPDFNLEIHQKSFNNLTKPKQTKRGPAFLPPINKVSLENLKKKVGLIKLEDTSESRSLSPERRQQGSGGKVGLHRRRDSETERAMLVKRLDRDGFRKKRNSI